MSSGMSRVTVKGGGPVVGAYMTFTFGYDALANSEVRIYRIVAPCALRIMEVSHVTTTTTSDPLIEIKTDGTDLIVAVAMAASATAQTWTPTSSPGLVEAQRDVAKGDIILVTLTADSGDAVVDGTLVISCFTSGHVVALIAND